MAETFTSILEAFTTYRQTARKGPYPAALRRRAIEQLTRSERLELGGRLGLSPTQMARWESLMRPKKSVAAASAFFEVQAPPPPSAVPEPLQIEVVLRGGAVLRMRGHVDAASLKVVIAAAQEAGVER